VLGLFTYHRPMAQLVTGTVKWFSEVKGYGFVIAEDGVDHHFAVSDVQGATLPSTGDKVQFIPGKGRRGPKARQVSLLSREGGKQSARPRAERDDRVVCPSCSKHMIPRIITGPPLVKGYNWTPVPKRSICPFCGATFQEFPASPGERLGATLFILVIVVVIGAIALSIATSH
jgi:cold shock CspA family protein/rubredoxin